MCSAKNILARNMLTEDRPYLGMTVAVSVIVGHRRWREDFSVLCPVFC